MKSITRLILVVLLHGSLASWAAAETVVVHNLPFQIDGLVELDSETVKVSFLGESRIIAAKELAEYVVTHAFNSKSVSQNFTSVELESFARDAFDAGEANQGSAALSALLLKDRGRINPNEAQAFLQEVFLHFRKSPSLLVALKKLMQAPDELIAAPYIALGVGVLDVDWLRANLTTFVYQNADEIKSLATELFGQALQADDRELLSQVIDFLGNFFGLNEPLYRKLKLVQSRMNEIERASNSGRFESLFGLIKNLEEDLSAADLLGPFVVRAIHTNAQLAIASSDPDRALRVLGLIKSHQRTPTTHDLLLKALAMLKPSLLPAYFDRSVLSLLREVAINDGKLQGLYIRVLNEQLSFFLNRAEVTKAEQVLKILVGIRPDPNSENDQLRYAIALTYLTHGQPELAQERLGEMQRGISISQRYGLLKAGYYSGFGASILVALLIAFPVAAVLLGLLGILRRASSTKRKSSENSVDSQQEFQRRFVSNNVSHNSPRFEEYRRCLNLFGLTQEATIKQIKSAYRAAVKEVHPDVRAAGDEIAAKRFIELTNTYERLVALRRELELIE
ncbi:MAG: J domain-containing protein [Bdellovibrionales bacterium]|nr:J domain-containing protein [Bdellovibrionales bacterium]